MSGGPDDAIADRVAARLASYLGPTTARAAVDSFARKALGRGRETLVRGDFGALRAALRPMLGTFVGRARCDAALDLDAPDPDRRSGRWRWYALAAFPFAFGAVIFVATGLARGTWVRGRIDALGGLEGKLLAVTGALLAAREFDRGDYLRRGWSWLATAWSMLLANEIYNNFVGARGSSGPFGGVFFVAANAMVVVGVVVLARAWVVAGIELPGARGTQWALVLAALGAAGVLVGPGLLDSARSVGGGNLAGLLNIAAGLSDGASFCLLVPVALTALAVRGGSLWWPWALLTLGTTAWIAFDAWSTVSAVARDAEFVQRVSQSMRALAWTLGFAAGVAQKLAVEPRSKTAP